MSEMDILGPYEGLKGLSCIGLVTSKREQKEEVTPSIN